MGTYLKERKSIERNRKIERRRRNFLPIFLGMLGAFIFIQFFGTFDYTANGLGLRAKIDFTEVGSTAFYIPPIGSVKARTHSIPIEVSLELRSIDPKAFQDTGEIPSDLIAFIKPKMTLMTKLYIKRLFLLGSIGGFMGALLVKKNKWSSALGGAISGVAIVFILVLTIYFTYDTSAFLNPEYHGFLGAAPWVMQGFGNNFSKVNQLGGNLQVLAENLYKLFERMEYLGTLGALNGEVIILHVSDIHNNPIAFELMEKIISTFHVKAIIDTGDITDLGTGLEIDLLMKLRTLDVPYIFVPGNHDSQSSVNKLSTFSNVKVLQDEFYYFEGLEILGVADPAFRDPAKINPSQEDIEDTILKVEELLEGKEHFPNILAIHNNIIGKRFCGKVPVILHGHDHRLKVSQEMGSVISDAGTTGAAGIRGLQKPQGVPYTFSLLHFAKSGDVLELVAVDTIKVDSLQTGFTLERTMIADSL